MRIIIIMLVFELSDRTALKSVIISDNLPVYHGAAWLHVYATPVIFNHYSPRCFTPRARDATPLPTSTHQQVIVVMNSKIIGLIRAGFMLCFGERGTAPIHNSPDVKWFAKPILKFLSACYYVQTVPAQIIRGSLSLLYIYLFILTINNSLVFKKIGNFRYREYCRRVTIDDGFCRYFYDVKREILKREK